MECPHCHQEIEVEPIIIASGEDFENYLCKQLNSLPGVQCETTKATGDQGADLVLTLTQGGEGKRIAIQCKLYSSPVGNDAVQEVIAGRIFYKCDLAMVVSNNTYTDSAKALAAAADVTLLDYRNLKEHISRLSDEARRAQNQREMEEQHNRYLEIEREKKLVKETLDELNAYLERTNGLDVFGRELTFLVKSNALELKVMRWGTSMRRCLSRRGI